MDKKILMPRRAVLLALLLLATFGLHSLEAAGGLLLFTANGSPYVDAVVYESFSSPSAHLSYVTVKGGGRTQIQSRGIIANIPYPVAAEVSSKDADSMVAQTAMYAARYPQYAKLLQSVGALWKRSAEAARLAESRVPVVPDEPSAVGSGNLASKPVAGTVIPLIRMTTGQEFNSARILKIEGDQASVSHTDGITKIALADVSNLPDFPANVRSAVEKVQADLQAQKKAEEERVAAEKKEQERLANLAQERLQKDKKNREEMARVARETEVRNIELIKQQTEAKAAEEKLLDQKRESALNTSISSLFGTPVSMSAVTELLCLDGFKNEVLKNKSGNIYHHFVNNALDLEVNAAGDKEITMLSIIQQTGRRDKETTVEGHAHFRDIVSFIVPTAGQWVFETSEQLLTNPGVELTKSKRFGGFIVIVELEKSAIFGKISGVKTMIKWSPDSDPESPLDNQRLRMLVLDDQELAKLKQFNDISITSRVDLKDVHLLYSAYYIDANTIKFHITRETPKVVWDGGFCAPLELKERWRESSDASLCVKIDELPYLMLLLSEKLRRPSNLQSIKTGEQKLTGSLPSQPNIAFKTPDILEIHGELTCSDIFELRQLLASLPRLKEKLITLTK